MKYTNKILQKIQKESDKGLSGRQIALKLGISKSGVNAYLKQTKNFVNAVQALYQEAESKPTGPKILLLDIETSASLVYAFGRHKQFIHQDAVVQEGGVLLMAGYQWLHEGVTNVLVNKTEVKQGKDFTVVKAVAALLEEADAVVAHNGRSFDMKMLQARALINGLEQLPTVHILDTLEMAKKNFRLSSNKLDSVGAVLGLGRKIQNSGIDLWVKVQQGDEDALIEMVEYCEGDVDLLRDVFLDLRSRGLVSGFNAANYYNDNLHRCKTCGSDNIVETGRIVTTPTGRFEEVLCNDCGSKQRKRDNLSTKEKRKSLLAAPKG